MTLECSYCLEKVDGKILTNFHDEINYYCCTEHLCLDTMEALGGEFQEQVNQLKEYQNNDETLSYLNIVINEVMNYPKLKHRASCESS